MAKDIKEQTEGVEENKKSLTAEYFDDKAEKSRDNKSKGGEFVEVNLTNTTTIKFLEDFGKHIKKDQVLTVSDVAYEIYAGKAKVEKLN